MQVLRKFVFGVALLTVVLIFNSCSDNEDEVFRKGDQTPIHLAVLLDLEGEQSTLGQDAMNGFVLGLQNASSVESPYVYASLVDTKTDPKVTLNSAKAVLPNVVV
ncbi:MAG: hypothetical protein AAGG81_02945, partial [Chlamydiota bacterium]